MKIAQLVTLAISFSYRQSRVLTQLHTITHHYTKSQAANNDKEKIVDNQFARAARCCCETARQAPSMSDVSIFCILYIMRYRAFASLAPRARSPNNNNNSHHYQIVQLARSVQSVDDDDDDTARFLLRWLAGCSACVWFQIVGTSDSPRSQNILRRAPRRLMIARGARDPLSLPISLPLVGACRIASRSLRTRAAALDAS